MSAEVQVTDVAGKTVDSRIDGDINTKAPPSSQDESISSDTGAPSDLPEEDDEDCSTPEPRFHVHQKVYAKDHESGFLYEATVRKTIYGAQQQKQIKITSVQSKQELEEMIQMETQPMWHYFVHYTGWNVKWDRWISESDLYEPTDSTKRFAKRLAETVKAIKEEMRQTYSQKPSQTKVMSELERRIPQLERERRLEERREELKARGIVVDDAELEDAKIEVRTTTKPKSKWTKANVQKEIRLRERHLQSRRKQAHADLLVLPFSLKKILVEEWEIITQCDMLVKLPSSVPVRQALDQYYQSKVESPSTSEDGKTSDGSVGEQNRRWADMIKGIEQFFNQAIPDRLLYPQEHRQYELLMQDAAGRKSEVYGCEFLLRLFVRLPVLLAEEMTEEEYRPILAKVNDLVRFLHKKQSTLFIQQYRKRTDEDRIDDEHSGVKRKAVSPAAEARKQRKP